MKLSSSKQPLTRPFGFSLLEAIVAITIMAGFGMAVFAWINTNLVTIEKIEKRAYKDLLIRNVSSFMQDVDIMVSPNGQEQLSNYSIVWQSSLVEPIKDGRNQSGGLSEFQLGLYDTNVKVLLESREVIVFDIRLVGYEKIRDFQNVF